MIIELDNIMDELQDLKRETDIMNHEDFSFKFGVLETRIKNASEECRIINHREGLVGLRNTNFKQLDLIKKDFIPYSKVWFSARDFFYHSPRWLNGPMIELDRDAISDEVN